MLVQILYFLHFLKLTATLQHQLICLKNCLNSYNKFQGYPDASGALLGAEEEVIRFFRKSNLDQASLSQIWALADVNKDGYLNCDEFSIAFHLIVIHTKVRIFWKCLVKKLGIFMKKILFPKWKV